MGVISLSVQCFMFKVDTSLNNGCLTSGHVDGSLSRNTYCVTTVAFPILGIPKFFNFMLTYKNLAKDIILKDFRNIRYANANMYFGFNNFLNLDMELKIDVVHLSLQADVFAREMVNHKGKIDFKRYLGPSQIDWPRILHHAYVYDRIKCIYYGVNASKIAKLPENMHSFPGNVLLANLLIKNSFRFDTRDSQPFTFFVKIIYSTLPNMFDDVFLAYPDLKQGMSTDPDIISYVNMEYEQVMNGLFYADEYLSSKKENKKPGDTNGLFEICELNSSKIEAYTVGDSNPVANSFLNDVGDKFYFVIPPSESKPEALRYNASVFISRAVGLCSQQLSNDGNSFYKVASRSISSDIFARDEVFSVTGLRTEIIPYSEKQIKEYLGINTLKLEKEKTIAELNGGNAAPQQPPIVT